MNLDHALSMARAQTLYPSVILHGGSYADRLESAALLARTLLCEQHAAQRPCGTCRHCRRVQVPDPESETFHPDYVVVFRDRATSTSLESVRTMLKTAQVSPFEARGQVFVITDADTLLDGAANALLKNLEEPATSAPRHFLLLTPSAVDLLETLRSRSLSIFLGSVVDLDTTAEEMEEAANRFLAAMRGYRSTGSAVYLLAAADSLQVGDGWNDARNETVWSRAATLVKSAATSSEEDRSALLELAAELLEAPELRLRMIPPRRLIEGLVAKTIAR